MRPILALVLLASGFLPGAAQKKESCNLSLRGVVRDAKTGENLPGATIIIKEITKGAAADDKGNYSISGICPGTYTLLCSFEGFRSDSVRQQISHEIRLNFNLAEDTTQLESVTVQAEREIRPLITQNVGSVEGHELESKRGQSLGESLKGITGVYAIQTGPTISKPVIHGLYSNRVLILNNGIRLEGQQWGSEHAPELDPFIAQKLMVVKGAASIRYGSDAMGGVVLVEPAAMRDTRGVDGELTLVGATNGRMGAVSGMLQGALDNKLSGFSWRIQGTFRKAGNFRTPGYYLENTGLTEKNYSITMAYKHSNYGFEVFFSDFNTKLGIFSGSYAQTIGDIQRAIARPEPITPSYFSYNIGRPYQLVNHELLKVKGFLDLSNGGRLEATFAQQINQRSEFSYVPLSGSENPELYLELITHTLDVVWKHAPVKRFSGSVGLNGITQGNVRDYQFLIPNYRNYGAGIFAIERWTKGKFAAEAGVRYDYRWLRAYYLESLTGNRIEPTYIFNNLTGTLGLVYDFSDKFSLQLNTGTAWRPPSANELFSNGVHQSAAAYENGNLNLKLEQAFNTSLSVHYHTERWSVEGEGYSNNINNYIYLRPDLTFVKTVRGSFPSYTYTPANVVFRGLDASVGYHFNASLSFTTKASFIWAYNNSINDYLIYTPANRIDNALRYEWVKLGKLTEAYFSITNLNIAQQQRVPQNSDYAPPPQGYVLFGAEAGFTLQTRAQPIMFSLSITNLFNTAYRDYMNRFRYFADDLGSNFTFRVKVPFDFAGKPK